MKFQELFEMLDFSKYGEVEGKVVVKGGRDSSINLVFEVKLLNGFEADTSKVGVVVNGDVIRLSIPVIPPAEEEEKEKEKEKAVKAKSISEMLMKDRDRDIKEYVTDSFGWRYKNKFKVDPIAGLKGILKKGGDCECDVCVGKGGMVREPNYYIKVGGSTYKLSEDHEKGECAF